jgi:branched-subunit amino acid transport protein
MNEFLLVLGMAVVTFAVRYPVMALVGRVPLPEPIFDALRYVPPAVLAAIIVPAVVMPEGGVVHLGIDNARLVAAIVTALVAWRTKNLLLTIVLGMLALWGYGWLLSAISAA